ncbi:hypothetical protein DFH09DRAFT_1304440 [Mycena vulgaris]|nr:hypothetical protein DFH09DRAFT_1304440 [Mycena vulgaris]
MVRRVDTSDEEASPSQQNMSASFTEHAKTKLKIATSRWISNCDELIWKPAKALSDDMLKLLFVSVQQNNIDLCIEYALPNALKLSKGQGTDRLYLVRTTSSTQSWD